MRRRLGEGVGHGRGAIEPGSTTLWRPCRRTCPRWSCSSSPSLCWRPSKAILSRWRWRWPLPPCASFAYRTFAPAAGARSAALAVCSPCCRSRWLRGSRRPSRREVPRGPERRGLRGRRGVRGQPGGVCWCVLPLAGACGSLLVLAGACWCVLVLAGACCLRGHAAPTVLAGALVRSQVFQLASSPGGGGGERGDSAAGSSGVVPSGSAALQAPGQGRDLVAEAASRASREDRSGRPSRGCLERGAGALSVAGRCEVSARRQRGAALPRSARRAGAAREVATANVGVSGGASHASHERRWLRWQRESIVRSRLPSGWASPRWPCGLAGLLPSGPAAPSSHRRQAGHLEELQSSHA